MTTTLTSKGQVTVPKHIRDALQLLPGADIEFLVNANGELVLQPATTTSKRGKKIIDRFEAVRGKAQVKWRTDDLMKLLRSDV